MFVNMFGFTGTDIIVIFSLALAATFLIVLFYQGRKLQDTEDTLRQKSIDSVSVNELEGVCELAKRLRFAQEDDRIHYEGSWYTDRLVGSGKGVLLVIGADSKGLSVVGQDQDDICSGQRHLSWHDLYLVGARLERAHPRSEHFGAFSPGYSGIG